MVSESLSSREKLDGGTPVEGGVTCRGRRAATGAVNVPSRPEDLQAAVAAAATGGGSGGGGGLRGGLGLAVLHRIPTQRVGLGHCADHDTLLQLTLSATVVTVPIFQSAEVQLLVLTERSVHRALDACGHIIRRQRADESDVVVRAAQLNLNHRSLAARSTRPPCWGRLSVISLSVRSAPPCVTRTHVHALLPSTVHHTIQNPTHNPIQNPRTCTCWAPATLTSDRTASDVLRPQGPPPRPKIHMIHLSKAQRKPRGAQVRARAKQPFQTLTRPRTRGACARARKAQARFDRPPACAIACLPRRALRVGIEAKAGAEASRGGMLAAIRVASRDRMGTWVYPSSELTRTSHHTSR
ncbi:hypothetical protein C8Q70DRAFT_146129 [Cubamyces menziesii]|nr:hypothetical protein C8Q70DRAFT_146129 [Cubamyces menziesii]